MLADKDIVRTLIPQGSPMIMVDTLLEHDGDRTVSTFYIETDNLFVQNGVFVEAGIIENMAQTAALRTGWIASLEAKAGANINPPLGVIGAVKDFMLHCFPEANTLLQTEIMMVASFANASIVRASTRSGKELLAEAELKIFIQD